MSYQYTTLHIGERHGVLEVVRDMSSVYLSSNHDETDPLTWDLSWLVASPSNHYWLIHELSCKAGGSVAIWPAFEDGQMPHGAKSLGTFVTPRQAIEWLSQSLSKVTRSSPKITRPSPVKPRVDQELSSIPGVEARLVQSDPFCSFYDISMSLAGKTTKLIAVVHKQQKSVTFKPYVNTLSYVNVAFENLPQFSTVVNILNRALFENLVQ